MDFSSTLKTSPLDQDGPVYCLEVDTASPSGYRWFKVDQDSIDAANFRTNSSNDFRNESRISNDLIERQSNEAPETSHIDNSVRPSELGSSDSISAVEPESQLLQPEIAEQSYLDFAEIRSQQKIELSIVEESLSIQQSSIIGESFVSAPVIHEKFSILEIEEKISQRREQRQLVSIYQVSQNYVQDPASVTSSDIGATSTTLGELTKASIAARDEAEAAANLDQIQRRKRAAKRKEKHKKKIAAIQKKENLRRQFLLSLRSEAEEHAVNLEKILSLRRNLKNSSLYMDELILKLLETIEAPDQAKQAIIQALGLSPKEFERVQELHQALLDLELSQTQVTEASNTSESLDSNAVNSTNESFKSSKKTV